MGSSYRLSWGDDDNEPQQHQLSGWDKFRLAVIAALLGAIFQQTVLTWLIR